jgi:predicted membrane channel-forming protein YqfA (hemolysin III family)
MPPHLQFNRYVLHGYRAHPLSPRDALWSLFGYLHNETAHIFTHLAGAALCAYWLLCVDAPAGEPHYLVVDAADACSLLCFLGSVAYHTLMNTPRREGEYRRLMALDLAGIWLVNAGAALSLTWLLLPCAPLALKLALALGPTVASALYIVFLARTPASRAKAFGVLWLGRVAVITATAAFSLAHWPAAWLAFHLASELSTCVGAVINVLRIPEKWYPGRFDFWLQSHTLMHVCVAFSMFAQHYIGLDRAHYIHGHAEALQCTRGHWNGVFGGMTGWWS